MEVFSVFATLSLVDLISNPLGRVQGVMKSLGLDTSSLGARMGNLALAMAPVALAAGLVMGALGMASAKAMAFESAMADVAKVVNFETDAELKAMSGTIMDMAGRIPMAADGIAAIVAAAAQSGVAKQDLTEFAEQAAKMGVAFDLTGDQAGKMMADWRAGMDLTLPQVYSLADAVNHLSNNMNATAPALGQVIQRVGAVAMTAGLAETQVAALGAAFLSSGAGPEIAATALKNFTTTLVKGSAMSKDQAAAFQSIGFSATQMAKDMQTDAQGTIFKVLQAIADKPKELQTSLLTEMFGQESLGAIAPLLKNMGNLSQAFGLVGDASQYAGSMQAEYETRSKTTANALQLLSNKLTNLAISIGTIFLPAISAGANFLGYLADAVRMVVETPFGQWLVAVIGGVSTLLVSLTALSAAMWFFSAVGPMVGKALLPLKAAVLGLGAPFWALIAVVGALYLAYRSNFGGIADTLDRWWANTKLVVQGVIAVFQSLKDGSGEIRGELATKIKAAGLVGLVTTVSRIVNRIRVFFAGMADGISAAMHQVDVILVPVKIAVIELMDAIGDLFGGMDGDEVGKATGGWRAFGKTLGDIAGGALTFVAKGIALLTDGLRWCVDAASGLAGELGGNLSGAFGMGLAVIRGYGDGLREYYTGLWNALSAGFDTLATAFGRVWERIESLFSSLIKAGESVGAAFSQLWSAIAPLFAKLFGGEVATGASAWESFGNLVGNVVAASLYVLTTAIQAVVNTIDMLANGVRLIVSLFIGDMTGAADALRSIVGGLGEGFAALGDLFGVGDSIRAAWGEVMAFFDGINLFESGAKLLMTFVDGIKSMAMAPFNAVCDALQAVRNLLPFSDAKEGPLSTLTLSGSRLMSTIAEGVMAGAKSLYESVSGALGSVGNAISGWWRGLFGGGNPVPEINANAVPQSGVQPLAPTPRLTMSDMKIAEPDVGVADIPYGRRRAEWPGSGGNNTTTITINNLNLPSIEKAEDFAAALMGEMAQYGEA